MVANVSYGCCANFVEPAKMVDVRSNTDDATIQEQSRSRFRPNHYYTSIVWPKEEQALATRYNSVTYACVPYMKTRVSFVPLHPYYCYHLVDVC